MASIEFTNRSTRFRQLSVVAILAAAAQLTAGWLRAADAVKLGEWVAAIRAVSPQVLTDQERQEAAEMIDRDLDRKSNAVNARSSAEWREIGSREEWDAYCEVRLERLRASLGEWPTPPQLLNVRVTGTVSGEGFSIENLLYESRPGQWVTGNLYIPAKATGSMPGILIAHAHHRPKEQSELQDMGMTWARAGCCVLVIDQVGYGERRAHPFHTQSDYPQEFRVSRQDYFFRYDSGIQLQLAGDSLMGWMVWDLMRGVDLLLGRPGTDPKRILLLGAVAGGGDPCGVTAALDPRIAAAVPFNFGGPQPETLYPLPPDAETWFNYLGGAHWESTRGLRRGGVDGFLHWVIVASIAPRRLIHAHEFAWDGERDPVWKRYRRVYDEFYAAPENLAYAHGKGQVSLSPAEASHCTNIGAYHRRLIHPAFQRWFDIRVTPEDEYSFPRAPEELTCLTDAARSELKPQGFVDLVSQLAAERMTAARRRRAQQSPSARRQQLRAEWSKLLGNVEPPSAKVKSARQEPAQIAGASIERVVLEVEPDVVVCMLVLTPPNSRPNSPAVVALAQAGKEGFLRHRAVELAELLSAGAIVCLPDVRGTGETMAGTSRDRTSGDVGRSANALLHGETMLGQRLRDLRSVLSYLRSRADVDSLRISLWGDSFATPNHDRTDFRIPRDVDEWPTQSEPLGGLLAMLGSLMDDRIDAVYIRGGLSDYHSVLTTPRVLIPHDVVVPGVLTVGDLSDLASALAPRPLRLEGLVDGLNRELPDATLRTAYQPAVASYAEAGAEKALSIGGEPLSPKVWLLEH